MEASHMQERVDVPHLIPPTEEDPCERNGTRREAPAKSMANARM